MKCHLLLDQTNQVVRRLALARVCVYVHLICPSWICPN